jgi:hypothetical protein
MSTTRIRSAECPVCQRRISLLSDGTFRWHGPKHDPCLGVCRTPESAATLVLPPLTDDQLDLMRECHRVGDWRPIELEFGIRVPQYQICAATPEEELARMVETVRSTIVTLVNISTSRGARGCMA